MSTRKVAQINEKRAASHPKVARMTQGRQPTSKKSRSKSVRAATKLAIELHREALKELERY